MIKKDNYLACSSKYETAWPTVVMVSACSSGIEILNSFSNSIINSTVSRLSAPRSLVKEASGVTSASSTPNLSTIIFFTLVAMSDMIVRFSLCWVQKYTFCNKCKEIDIERKIQRFKHLFCETVGPRFFAAFYILTTIKAQHCSL